MTSTRDAPGSTGQPSTSVGGQAAGEDFLAWRLSELARNLQAEDTLQDTLDGIVRAAVSDVPGAQYAGISLVAARRKVTTPAWTDERVRACDQAQYETRQGPCLDAVYEERTVRLSDMRAEERWPEFTKRAAELGIGSMLCFQLFVEGDNLGALNLYSQTAGAFDDESVHVGLLFASHASVAMAGAQQHEQMDRALATRDLIGRATGILMERHKLTSEQAFTLLIRASQITNTKLRDVADRLVTTGELATPET